MTAAIGEPLLLAAFERALGEGRLRLAYQPKVNLANGRIERAEALIRWNDPELGSVAPDRFIPIAEEHGWIDQLTLFGLNSMLTQSRAWRDRGIDLSLAFNISALSLQYLDFPDLVERLCQSIGVPLDRLVLELTEGATQPLIKLMDTLTRFRIKGIGLAIDDFGTGYSSLLQLRRLPFTEVKIDRAFIEDVHISAESRTVVTSIVDLAHGLGLIATAEGVENEAQLELLEAIGCDFAQGYLISPPIEAEAMADFLRLGWREARQAETSKRTPWASGSSRP